MPVITGTKTAFLSPYPWEMGLACMLVHRPATEVKASWVSADLNLSFSVESEQILSSAGGDKPWPP